jgi:tetratricopeptide (TPR) repeat protein
MGLFDFLFRRRREGGGAPAPAGDPPGPDDLRRQVFDAVAAGDAGALERLCRRHREAIRQHFSAWRKPPDDVRDQPARMQGYVHALVTVAELFAQRLGVPELMNELTGTPESNPALKWQQALDQARQAMEELRYRETAELLTDLLIDVRKLRGSAVDTYLPITYGYLGECYFQSAQADKAVAPTRQALELCERAGDAEGRLAYLGNLYEIHRYLGEAEEAAGYAERLAGMHAEQGRAGEAERYRKQSGLVRAGEPLNRVVVTVEGKRYEMDEVAGGREGSVQFAFERNRMTLRPCEVLTERGKEAGGQGRFDEALGLFREAGRADRYAPEPRYQAGWTLLHLQRYPEAVDSYDETERLAPGWFHCRSDLWLAQQLALGKLPHELFLLCGALEDGPLDPEAKVRLAEQGLARAPDLALLHYHHGKNLKARNLPFQAQAALRRGLNCADEPDVRTRLLVELATLVDGAEEKRHLLRQAVELNGNLVAAAMARVVLAFE